MNYTFKAAIFLGCLMFFGIILQAQVKNIHACFNAGNCHFSAKNNSKKTLEVQYRLWRLESSTATSENENSVLLGVVQRNGNIQTGEVVSGIIYQDNLLFSIVNDENFNQGIIYQDNLLFGIIYQDNLLFNAFDVEDITFTPIQEGTINMPRKKRKRIDLEDDLEAGTYVLVMEIMEPLEGKMSEKEAVDWQVYPNPTSNRLTINLPNIEETFELTLVDLNGNIIYQEAVKGSQHHLEVGHWSKGIYLMRLEGKEEVYQQKLLLD